MTGENHPPRANRIAKKSAAGDKDRQNRLGATFTGLQDRQAFFVSSRKFLTDDWGAAAGWHCAGRFVLPACMNDADAGVARLGNRHATARSVHPKLLDCLGHGSAGVLDWAPK